MEDILPYFDNVDEKDHEQWSALCPAHSDTNNSLSIKKTPERWLLHCHAGCKYHDIREAAGLEEWQLHNDNGKPHKSTPHKSKPEIVEEYDYEDENRDLLYQAVRMEPKDFRQRVPDGADGWIWRLGKKRRVLYRLPDLRRANPCDPVYVVEGEKDVNRLYSLGLVATCNVGGAGKWKEDYNEHLTNRRVVIVPDNDEPGHKHADKIANALNGKAKWVRIVNLPDLPEKGDISDWLNNGGTKAELIEIAKSTPKWEPSLDESKWKTSLFNAEKKSDDVPSTLGKPEDRTDNANARRLVEQYRDVIRWCDPWGKWLVWDQRRWAIDDIRRIELHAKHVADQLWKDFATLARTADKGTIAKTAQFVKSSNGASGIRNMLALARSEEHIPIRPPQLDADPWLLNLENGTLDLRTCELREHNKNDYITKVTPVKYDKAATCPTWMAFLKYVLDGNRELAEYLRRLVGYCLSGNTQEHILPFLYGVGANGKSTFITTVLALLGPDYSIKAPTDLLLTKGDTHPTERADLHGKRFVACVEAEDGRRLAESLVKELTGGDKVRARRMREDFWEFDATHKVWLAANHKPTIRGTDHAIWRRVKVIPFTVTIPDHQQDKQLPEKLMHELPGILNWALKGCRQWQDHGLQEPDEVRLATSEYRADSDIIGQFIDQRCVVGKSKEVGTTRLYKNYREWCEKSGERATNMTAFGRQLNERGFTKRKTKHQVRRVGITLVEVNDG